ncbi:regakine-1-like [Mustela nigripes]|uniref:C-C motif chemokine n=2 Tax=Mustela putorius furo TaxID=9669 RepID=M3YU63_MUSPF|nr:regakine-1 [Mustela putorius furo]XP_059235026.1 regakine-1-like [Mustela nigripes]
MKVILATLTFFLILAALHSEANEEPVNKLTIIKCCFTYVSRKIPLQFVESYNRTSNQCSTPGVIFLTRKGRQVCADPNVAWVQEHMKHLDHKSQRSESRGPHVAEEA